MTSKLVVNNIGPDAGISTVAVDGDLSATKFVGPIVGSVEATTGTFSGDVTVSGNLGVAGTLTYEDVTRVDATGLSTFRDGINIGPLAGIALTAYKDGSIRSSGIVTASSFSGSLASSNLTGALPAIDGSALTGVTAGAATTATYAGSWILGANGTSDYTFTGTGLTGTVNEATLTLQRGKKYIFKNRSGGHPFRIQTSYQDTSGTLYNTGVTNNGGGDGTDIIFDVPQSAPDALYYQCSSHSGMSGRINIGKYQVQVLARRNGNLTGHNSNTTQVKYNYIHTSDSTNDASTYFDTSTGLLTAPVSGMYLINAAARSSNQAYSQAWLRVDNGREQWTDVVFPSATNFACSTHMVYLNAGQTVGYQPYESGGTNGQINDDNNHTYFRCVLIS
jgi:hypothetical protein